MWGGGVAGGGGVARGRHRNESTQSKVKWWVGAMGGPWCEWGVMAPPAPPPPPPSSYPLSDNERGNLFVSVALICFVLYFRKIFLSKMYILYCLVPLYSVLFKPCLFRATTWATFFLFF